MCVCCGGGGEGPSGPLHLAAGSQRVASPRASQEIQEYLVENGAEETHTAES